MNLYVTPVTRTEFLLGKQLPYIAMAMVSFLLMVLMAITVFGVPVKGSFLTLALATLLFVVFSTVLGLLASIFTKSQIAAIFITMLVTMLPAVSYSGLMTPVSSLEGAGRVIGDSHPATYMLLISRGVFGKGLDFGDLAPYFLPLLAAAPLILLASILLLKKQER